MLVKVRVRSAVFQVWVVRTGRRSLRRVVVSWVPAESLEPSMSGSKNPARIPLPEARMIVNDAEAGIEVGMAMSYNLSIAAGFAMLQSRTGF